MEFGHIGKHCSEPSCRTLDFLPFTCSGCGNVYCLDHRTAKAHNCSHKITEDERKLHTCPLCDTPLTILKDQDINEIVELHIQRGCKSEQEERRASKKCSVKGCKTIELVPIVCQGCQKQFCLKHRFDVEHNCPRLQKNQSNMKQIGPFKVPIKVK